MTKDGDLEDLWHSLLTDPDHPAYQEARKHERFWKRIPGDPRCKMCLAPLGGAAAPFLRFSKKAPSANNPRFCNACDMWTNANPGGAEVELTFMFADVRGSTSLAQEMGTRDFARLMNRFYRIANRVLVKSDAWIDKPVGDEVRGFYMPVFADHHARDAILAAQSVLEATGHGDPDGPWLPMGAGVHTGVSYMGAVGVEGSDSYDVTALGDTVNTVARLASTAATSEVLISERAYEKSGLDLGDLEHRSLELKGRADPLPVRVLTVDA